MLIDNKKTREISWNDFELEGNKENLIKQGWDSFEPYGFGEFIGKAPEEVFEDGYALNVIPRKFEELSGEVPTDNRFYSSSYDVSSYRGEKVSITTHYGKVSYNQVSIGLRNSTSGKWVSELKTYDIEDNMVVSDLMEIPNDDGVYLVYEYYGVAGSTNGNKYHIINRGISLNTRSKVIYPRWQDLTEEEKPVNAYEKGYTYIQPLDNGFTRVRTKGGDTDMKLKSPNFGQLAETGTDMTISLYVENNSDSMIRFSNNLAIGGVPYPDGAEYMITVPREYKGFTYLKGGLVGRDVELDIRSDGNIDTIVSQPEIIEGHDLNAMLLIEDLDDGRKHVQVHNVNENTKLVYTGGDVIKGEPYTLETEIENDGRIFNLSANMFDSVVEVQKGMNDIRESGELQDKELKIEIGVD